ncbi:MAG: DUF2442 domain-containing protein [Candidatus Latescibacteria bacterium]|nr:DUF2442 domain-containing protein [Candidatus Latescibacterota bacterium]
MSRSLPPRAHLEHLKKQAKDLLRLATSGDAAAIARSRVHLTRLSDSGNAAPADLTLQEAQFVIAREYGFSSWSELSRAVEPKIPGEQRFAQVPYQAVWPKLFESEKERLRAVFGRAALEIEHIGSTAIEGLSGRGTIDIAVMVTGHDQAAGFKSAILDLGYDPDPQNWTYPTERDFYSRGNPRDYHLSVAYADRGGFWDRQIMFRDYLRTHREAREAYAELKAELAAKDDSGKGYARDKTEFVYEILTRAGWRYGQIYAAPGQELGLPPTPISVESRANLELFVVFDDGKAGTFDMTNLVGRYMPHLAAKDFTRVRVEAEGIRWETGAVIDSAYLYRHLSRT